MSARPLLPLLAAACLLSACQSVPMDRVVETGGEAEIVALDAYDARLLDLQLAPGAGNLAGLRAELGSLAEKPGLSRRLLSRIGALRAEAALLARDLPAALELAKGAAALSDAEEGAWRVRAALEPDPAKRLALLDQGLAKSDARARLLCERGRQLLAAGRYAEAAQDLDEGLRGLAPGYRELYGADRDKAFSLAGAGLDPTRSPSALAGLDAPLTVRAMVERAFSETRLLTALSSEPSPAYASVLPAVKKAGLLLQPDAPADSPVTRKQAAFFLWGIVARMEHDPKLLTAYRSKYKASPVEDVPVDAPWFDAALGVVEQEIMDLPDGVRFMPDAPLTGMDYLGMLNAMKKRYR
jgi:hypothetical protein